MIAASEASSDTFFDHFRKSRAPADGKNPVPADNENAVAGKRVSDDYLSAISAHSKMAVVVGITVNSIVLHLLGETKWSFSFHGRRKTTHIYCFADFSKPLE